MTLCHGNFGFVMLSKLGRRLIAACIPKGGRVEGARSPVKTFLVNLRGTLHGLDHHVRHERHCTQRIE